MSKIKSQNEQDDSMLAIGKFIEANELSSKSSLLEFEATVEYPTKKIKENTSVQLSLDTSGYGKIEIINTKLISSYEIHTGFSIQWQNYTYDEINNILRIQGESAKMEGRYEVLIYPL